MLLRGAVLMALLCGIGTGAAAQDFGGALLKCTGIADTSQRLACYDALARAPELPAKQFGAEQLPRESNPAPAPEDNSITGTVTELSLTPFGRFVVTLDNGQIWRQLDADTARFVPPGNLAQASVTISRGALGSYNLQFAGQNGLYKVRRLK